MTDPIDFSQCERLLRRKNYFSAEMKRPFWVINGERI